MKPTLKFPFGATLADTRIALGVDEAAEPERVMFPQTVKLADGTTAVHVGVRDGQDIYTWDGGNRLLVGPSEFHRAVIDAQIANSLYPGSIAAAQDHAELRAECLALGVPLDGNETIDRLLRLREHYRAGRHLRQTAHDGAALIKELAEHFNTIRAVERKQRNAKKRKRRARRGK
jgi:hypothetical protein